MKKTMFYSLLMGFILSLTFGLTSCKSCGGGEPEKMADSTEVLKTAVTLDVENVISTDREAMYLKAGDNVRWYETTVVMTDYLSAPDCTGEIDKIINTFQKIVAIGKGYDTMVYKFKHYKDGTCEVDSIDGWWSEDYPLNDEPIEVSFKDAYELLMKANIVKPDSRYCVLRKEVGPNNCNPQYIFGNIKSQVYVDAVTGNVTANDPVFDGFGFGKPLGEWP